ncbi:hypothetical protein [Streptomyces albidus (ex Kaewkla and Franco 2022)]|jgi:hypothetical protein|uniref:hypothetical protein n=1 Tax=Streptomyces albidus (ex Kaewkla and Franco 2022) TaxID=722709 RepID=UPI0015EF8ABF|nr:hypothetical protein [Streptomyces albidus (ex Kaewkla and Franco 2022)]
MPLETVGEEMERLESERRRYELMLAATPESERDRRAHLQEWVDRRTARIDHMHDRRPLGRWFQFTLVSGAAVCAWGSWAVASFWPGMALAGLALFLTVSLRTGFLARLTRKAARKLTRRTHWEKAPRTGL